MATLITDVQVRYPQQMLVDLTRRRDTDTNTLDTGTASLLATACDDIESGDFPVYVQSAYDSTNRKHVTVAVEGVLAKLKVWARDGADGGQGEWDRWVARATALSKNGARARLSPSTTSELTPTDEVDSTETVAPMFDQADFDDVRPGP